MSRYRNLKMQRQNTLDVEQGVNSNGEYAQLGHAGAGQDAPSSAPMDVLSSCWQAVSRVFDCFGNANGNPNASSLARLPALEVNGELLVVRALEKLLPFSLALLCSLVLQPDKLIGEGGFSFVYLVHGANTKRRYAVKKVLCQTQEQVEAAQWEVSVHRELAPGRPHILGLQAATFRPATPVGQEAFIVLDFHAGGTVDDILASRRAQLGVTPAAHSPWCYGERDALQLFAGICQGVAAFHSHVPAWAHRDIKPANILLGSAASPVLMDFGSTAVARVSIASHADSLRLKEHAEANSSMAYRAPELWDPPARSTVTEASDIWALGCVLYALAFGFSPFEIQWVHPRGSEAAVTAGKSPKRSKASSASARTSVGGSVPQVVDVSHLRVLTKVPLPESHPYSAHFVQLVLDCLSQDPARRPDIGALQDRTHALLDMGDGRGEAAGAQGAFLGDDSVVYGSMASRAGAAHEIF